MEKTYLNIPLKTFILISLLIALLSCNKDEVVQHFPNKDFYNIDYDYDVDYIRVDGKSVFNYNAEGLVVRIAHESGFHTDFVYDSQGRLLKKYEIYERNTNVVDSLISFYSYKKNKIIIEERFSFDNYKHKEILYYNDNGECIRQELWSLEEEKANHVYLGNYNEYSWENGNLQFFITYHKYIAVRQTSFSYDSKVNPFRKLNCFLIPEEACGTYLSTNNVDTIFYHSVGTDKNTGGHRAFKYNYSDENEIIRYFYREEHKRWIKDAIIGLK